MKVKIFKCIYCDNKYVEKKALYEHMEKAHADNIPAGMSVAQHLFNVRNNKTHGSCIMCGKETKWNEKTEKYERLCSQKCQQDFRNMFKNRMINTHGKVHLLDDPEQQKKMLAHRKISGEYTWSDGVKKSYTGSYELDFLKVCDKMLGLSSQDVIIPAPMIFNYTDPEGKKRFYIPDAYIVSLNTVVEIKDGGDNPNKHHKIQDVDKVKEKIKDDIMRKQKQYNYVKITNKNYAILLNFLLDLKDQQADEEEVKLPIIRIEEAVNLAKHKLINQTPMIMCEVTSGLVGDLEKMSMINESPEILQETLLTENSNSKIYHLSSSNLDGHILNPAIPNNFFTKNGFEDSKTKRVCFAPSIDQCLMGISQNLTGKDFFVHIPDGNYKTKSVNKSQVPDSVITGEIWIEQPVKLKCIGKIHVIKDAGLDGRKFKYGGKYEAELYDWTWKWVEHFNEDVQLDLDSKSTSIMQNNYNSLMPKKLYGIPDTKQFPLNTPEQVETAIKNYMRGPKNKRKELADNICKRAYELGVPIKDSSLLWEYTDWKKPVETNKELLDEGFISSVINLIKGSKPSNTPEELLEKLEKQTIDILLDVNKKHPIQPEIKTEKGEFVAKGDANKIRFKNILNDRCSRSEGVLEFKVKNLLILTIADIDKEKVKQVWACYINKKGYTNRTQDYPWGVLYQLYPSHGTAFTCEAGPDLHNESVMLYDNEEHDFEENEKAFFELIQENFTIDSDGSMIINLREKTDFMSKYNLSHRLLKIYYKTDNIEGVKAELARLYYMYEIIEYYYVNGENNGVSKLQLRILAKNKKEALRAKPFIMNDFTTGLKFILEREKDFNFQKYFMETDYYKDVIKLDSTKIKGIKKLIKSVIF